MSVTPNTATGVLFRTAAVGLDDRSFAIYVPREYTPDKTWPCVVFLNGSGECGTDGSRQLAVGLLPAILAEPERWPVIAVFPQKPDQKSQWADHDTLVLAALDLARLEFNIDSSRIYLTGLSQGGGGTWSIGASHPDLWAALAPVCGYGDPAALAPRLINTPIWAFHGLKDDVVKPEQTISMIDAIKAEQVRTGKGVEPKATLFPEANHNAWDPTYRAKDLPEWLLAQRRER
jgi:predicted peptidase